MAWSCRTVQCNSQRLVKQARWMSVGSLAKECLLRRQPVEGARSNHQFHHGLTNTGPTFPFVFQAAVLHFDFMPPPRLHSLPQTVKISRISSIIPPRQNHTYTAHARD